MTSRYLKSFDELLPHLANLDQCKICIDNGDPEIDGIYDLIDYYCLEPDCECHKVTVAVLDSNQNHVATISYGLEKTAFYRKWGDSQDIKEKLLKGLLEPLSPQSKQAPQLLEVFSQMMENMMFKERFRNRYHLFKAEGAKIKEAASRARGDNVIPFPKSA